jgi:hypothetical protein
MQADTLSLGIGTMNLWKNVQVAKTMALHNVTSSEGLSQAVKQDLLAKKLVTACFAVVPVELNEGWFHLSTLLADV